MPLNISHLTALAPLLITGLAVVVVLLAIAWRRHHGLTFALTFGGLLAALLAVGPALSVTPLDVTSILRLDRLACYYMALILAGSLVVSVFAYAYLGQNKDTGFAGNREEFYLLLLLASAGALVLVCAQHLAGLFIGLELLSVPTYGMIAYAFFNRHSLEAGIKYMVLSALGSAFLLFGMALLYAMAGSLSFSGLAIGLANPGNPSLVQVGIGLLLAGLAFKLSLAPFHLWTPDVYQGAPAPVGAFLASVSKIAVFAVLLRFYQSVPAANGAWMDTLLTLIAVASILLGNLSALQQTNIKRLLGYSSIAHFGYLLVALVAGKGLAVEAINVYLLTYLVTTLGAFGVVSLRSTPFRGRDTDGLYQYRGLFWHHPVQAMVLMLMFLSLAGVPLTAGFIGKFYVLAAGTETGRWLLVGTLILGSAIALYYYLRVIVTLFLLEPGHPAPAGPNNFSLRASDALLLLVTALTLLLGVYPQPLLVVIAQAVQS